MTVCVTGGTGFLGRALVLRLLAQRHHVRILARASAKANELESRGAEFIRGNVQNPESIERAVRGADIVYHCAAKLASARTQDYFDVNVRGTESVLEACLKQRAGRIVYLSSLTVYGPSQPGQKINENTPRDPKPQAREWYAHSKIMAEERVEAFTRKTGLPVVIIRPGVIFGPGRPLPIALLGFHLGQINLAFGKRTSRIPLNYVENLVDALQLIPDFKDEERLRQFNILDDDNLTLGRYHSVRRQVQNIRTVFLPGRLALFGAFLAGTWIRDFSAYQVKRALEDRRYDTQRIRGELRWAPRVGLSDALRSSI